MPYSSGDAYTQGRLTPRYGRPPGRPAESEGEASPPGTGTGADRHVYSYSSSPYRLSMRLREFNQGEAGRAGLCRWMHESHWCWCGFYPARPGESVRRHVIEVFAPDDWIGADGQAHRQARERTCQCGFYAEQPHYELEFHILCFFVPDDSIGNDGELHNLMTGEYEPPEENRRPFNRWWHL